jgi:hypothetical protein
MIIEQSLLIPYSVAVLIFAKLLFQTGKKLIALESLELLALNYKKNPKKFGFFEKYFLGFGFLGLTTTLWAIKYFGDRFMTSWYRVSGGIFIVFSLIFTLGVIALWGLTLFI